MDLSKEIYNLSNAWHLDSGYDVSHSNYLALKSLEDAEKGIHNSTNQY